MDLIFIIFISLILFIAIITGLWKLTKKIIFSIIITLIIFILIFLIISTFVFFDLKSLSTNFTNQENLLLIEKDGEFITGISYIISEEKIFLINNYDLKKYKNKDYFDSYYKTIIIDFYMLEENLGDPIILNEGFNISKKDYLTIINSDNPLNKITQELSQKTKIPENLIKNFIQNQEYENSLPINIENLDIEDSSHLKLILFALGVKNIQDNSDNILPLLLMEYQNDRIKIYKETITFKLIKFIPFNFINENIIKKLELEN